MTAKRSNQCILKEISPGISLEGMMLKLKLQYFGHLMWRIDSLEKTDAGRDWGQEEKGTTGDEMAGWHHWLDGCESEWTAGVGDGQGGLVCCNSWGHKESDTIEQLNWTELNASPPPTPTHQSAGAQFSVSLIVNYHTEVNFSFPMLSTFLISNKMELRKFSVLV